MPASTKKNKKDKKEKKRRRKHGVLENGTEEVDREIDRWMDR